MVQWHRHRRLHVFLWQNQAFNRCFTLTSDCLYNYVILSIKIIEAIDVSQSSKPPLMFLKIQLWCNVCANKDWFSERVSVKQCCALLQERVDKNDANRHLKITIELSFICPLKIKLFVDLNSITYQPTELSVVGGSRVRDQCESTGRCIMFHSRWILWNFILWQLTAVQY